MRHRLVVVPFAEQQIRSAAEWWHANRPASPELLGEELAKAFDLITVQPLVGPRVAVAATPGIRRFHLSRIHYHVYYRVRDDVVEILAFWHTRRGSAPDL